jgi:hypothetical protein
MKRNPNQNHMQSKWTNYFASFIIQIQNIIFPNKIKSSVMNRGGGQWIKSSYMSNKVMIITLQISKANCQLHAYRKTAVTLIKVTYALVETSR